MGAPFNERQTEMSSSEVFEKVSQLMVDLYDLDKSKITPESTFEALELTSLDAIDLIVDLQQMLGKKVDEDAFKKIRTVGDVVALIEKELANAPAQDGQESA